MIVGYVFPADITFILFDIRYEDQIECTRKYLEDISRILIHGRYCTQAIIFIFININNGQIKFNITEVTEDQPEWIYDKDKIKCRAIYQICIGCEYRCFIDVVQRQFFIERVACNPSHLPQYLY